MHLLPGLTGWWWWGTQQRDIHHVPGKSWYLRICGCGAEGPQCDSLPADGDCEEEPVEWCLWCLGVTPPMESQRYALWVKLISGK